MVSLPLHGEIYAVYGDNIVAINNIFVIIDIHIGVTYTCTVVLYCCIAKNRYVFSFYAILMAC
jgi:hypothetical protein